MLGVNLVEPIPDQAMVVEIEAARDGDLGSGAVTTVKALR
jgi:hypothetical protein